MLTTSHAFDAKTKQSSHCLYVAPTICLYFVSNCTRASDTRLVQTVCKLYLCWQYQLSTSLFWIVFWWWRWALTFTISPRHKTAAFIVRCHLVAVNRSIATLEIARVCCRYRQSEEKIDQKSIKISLKMLSIYLCYRICSSHIPLINLSSYENIGNAYSLRTVENCKAISLVVLAG